MSLNIQKVQPIISDCHKNLNSIGKLSPEKIAKLPETIKQSIRDCTPARLKELAQMNCFAAEKVKAEFDKKYGENNYAVIAIGRSMASVAELMRYMGVDAKIIPISGLRRAKIENVPKDDLHIYKTFLVQKGLSKTDLAQNKDKTYILMDYTHYGSSLEKSERLLKRDDMLGNAENLISVPIKDVLGNSYVVRKFEYIFQFSRFKPFSFVGRLHIDNLKDVYEKCSPERVKEYQNNITNGIRKLFWFNVFDSYVSQNYSRVFPKHEMEAIYNHYLSPEATKRYLNREFNKNNKIIDEVV